MIIHQPHIPEAMDIIMVCGPTEKLVRGFPSRAIVNTLSTPERRCHHSHDGFILVDENNHLNVLNVVWPKARIDILHRYCAEVVSSGGRWCIARPRFMAEMTSLSELRKLRREFSFRGEMMDGKRYPLRDLWIIWKRYHGIMFGMQEERHARYCTQTGKFLFAQGDHPWCPDAWKNEFLPSPIHTELIAEAGELVLVEQSDPDFWDEICNKTPGGHA